MRPRSRLNALLGVALAFALAAPAAAFSCDNVVASGVKYDLTPLAGVHVVSQETDTPPTKSEARARFNLCDKVGKEDNVADEDQCAEDSRFCLTLVNHKPSAAEPDRVTNVIPIWTGDTPDSDIAVSAYGNGVDGLRMVVKSGEYVGTKHSLELFLKCAPEASDPELQSYTNGVLKIEWAHPSACQDAPRVSAGGGGFLGFLKFVFWLSIFAFVAYFVVGIVYNHQQYSARGWDLVPHRDFWRELPALMQDFGGHLFGSVRGSTGRGGYSSLG